MYVLALWNRMAHQEHSNMKHPPKAPTGIVKSNALRPENPRYFETMIVLKVERGALAIMDSLQLYQQVFRARTKKCLVGNIENSILTKP